jgi:hypothetical protein
MDHWKDIKRNKLKDIGKTHRTQKDVGKTHRTQKGKQIDAKYLPKQVSGIML